MTCSGYKEQLILGCRAFVDYKVHMSTCWGRVILLLLKLDLTRQVHGQNI